jgi:hypothetical protein
MTQLKLTEERGGLPRRSNAKKPYHPATYVEVEMKTAHLSEEELGRLADKIEALAEGA